MQLRNKWLINCMSKYDDITTNRKRRTDMLPAFSALYIHFISISDLVILEDRISYAFFFFFVK